MTQLQIAAASAAAIPDLFWSKRGDVACVLHAPAADDPKWKEERWVRLWTPKRRLRYQCQACHGTPVGRRVTIPDRRT